MRQLEDDLYTDLTETQEKILHYIEDCVGRGLPPTRKEIAAHMGFKSVNAAEEQLQKLEGKGRVKLIPGISRGILLEQMG